MLNIKKKREGALTPKMTSWSRRTLTSSKTEAVWRWGLAHPQEARLNEVLKTSKEALASTFGVFSAAGADATGTFREHSGNIQGTFREHSVNIQGTFTEHSQNIHRTFTEHSGNIQGTFREHSGNIQ
jgi:hypothetical protein